MTKYVSIVVLLAVIVVIGVLFVRVMSVFVLPLFLAALLVNIFQPVHRWMLAKCGQRPSLAAGLTTLVVLLAVFVPMIWAISLATVEGLHLMSQVDAGTVKKRLEKLRGSLGLEMPLAQEFRGLERDLEPLVNGAVRPSVRVAWKEEGLQVTEERDTGPSEAPDKERLARLNRLAEELRLPDSLPEEQGKLARRRLESLRVELRRAAQATPESSDAAYSLQVVARELRGLKSTLYGGALLTLLKELANPSDDDVRRTTAGVLASVQPRLLSVGGRTTAFLAKLAFGLAITMIALYFFLVDGPGMIQVAMKLSPLDDQYERELLDEFDRTSRAVVLATLLAALGQGLLAGLGYWVTGLESVFLLTLLTTVFALIPFVGAWVVWLPASLWLFVYEERTAAAVCLALYGLFVVSLADNVIRPLVLHGQSRLHPLLALLSVLGGVMALGPAGILVGPMIVVFLHALLKILQRELVSLEKQRASETTGTGTGEGSA